MAFSSENSMYTILGKKRRKTSHDSIRTYSSFPDSYTRNVGNESGLSLSFPPRGKNVDIFHFGFDYSFNFQARNPLAHMFISDASALQSFTVQSQDDVVPQSDISSLAIGPNNEVIVLDRANRKLKIFDNVGHLEHQISLNMLQSPFAVCLTQTNNFALTDEKGRVVILTPEGNVLGEFGQELRHPQGISVNHAGHFVVCDAEHRAVLIFSENGVLQNWIKMIGGAASFQHPQSTCSTACNHIVMTDFTASDIKVFNPQGQLCNILGANGYGVGKFHHPKGVCMDRTGCILVADHGNHCIHRISTDGKCKSIILNRDHGIHYPDCIAVNLQGHLVVAQGNTINFYTI